MFIQTEVTPNPNSLKFIPGRPLVSQGPYSFSQDQKTEMSPVATRLLGLEGVVSLLLTRDFIAVTKKETVDWYLLKPFILGILMESLASGHPFVVEEEEEANKGTAQEQSLSAEEKNPIIRQICELIETRVRPAVAADGGDIVFHSFHEGIVTLEMRGACSGCPSASATLKSGVESMLKHYIPEVLEVRSLSEDA